MVQAGLPGKMGVGVVVSMALEAWMAFTIARAEGIKVNAVSDIWKYFGLFAGTVVTILYLFRSLLGLGYSAFSVVPGINPIILAELFTTNLVGVLFWISFQEARDQALLLGPVFAWYLLARGVMAGVNAVKPEEKTSKRSDT
jgi:hypothetical protein